MKQVFVDNVCQIDTQIGLDEYQAHHIFDVLRTQQKETIRVVAGNEEVFLAHPQTKPYLYIFGREEVEPRLVDVTMCVALVKSDKFEWMLQKAAELGVSRIVPFVSRNSIIHLDPKKLDKKMNRWNAILDSACRQCNRADKVELMPLGCLENLKEYKSRCNLLAYEKSSARSAHLASYLCKNPSSVTAIVGPEGGFTLQEAEELMDEGFACVSLGNQILRTETAVCYILSCIEYQSHYPVEEEHEVCD